MCARPLSKVAAIMECAVWIKLRESAKKAMADWVKHEEPVPRAHPTAEQIQTNQRLKEELFRTISAIQQHEKEHGCRGATAANERYLA